MQRVSTFRSRLLLTLLGFVLLAELVVGGAILHTTYEQTVAQAREKLRVGNRVLDRLIALRSDQLQSTVGVLASDFGFKSAVATKDAATLKTTLANFGRRAHADNAVIADPSGHLVATVPSLTADTATLRLSDLIKDARQAGGAAGLVMIHHRPAQFVLVPVRAPRLIAWAGMGFVIDARLARTFGALTGLDVAFVVNQNGKPVYDVDSRHAAPHLPPQARADAFLSSRHALLDTGQTRLTAVLSMARESVLSGFYSLVRSLALIFVITLILSALVAIWLARRLSQPVRELSEFAGSVAAGQYTATPRSHGVGEFDLLTKALTNMQQAVSQRERRILHQATHDALTDLPNREAIRPILGDYIRAGHTFAAVRIAVHGFGSINSALGYRIGDEALRATALRLRACVDRRHDIARAEGNDFILLIRTKASDEALAQELESIRHKIEQPMQLLDTPLTLALEFGVVMVPRDADTLDSVWRRSIIARDHSRADHGRTFFYRPGIDERQRRELTLIRDLADAIRQNHLHLVYQPRMALANGAVAQVESLVRWQHPTLGFITPDEFIGLAERSGQIRLLTTWLAERVAAQTRRWQRDDMPLGVSINLSADELANPSLGDTIVPLLEAARSPQEITLEVTESAVLRDPKAALANLHGLQARGARVAIDDFGTGYSSFAQLKQLAADELKIDKSLVLQLDTTPADQSIVGTIIELGHKLGMQVVAEGIENEHSWRYLAELGADHIQGYYLARPMPPERLPEWLEQHRAEQARWVANNVFARRMPRHDRTQT